MSNDPSRPVTGYPAPNPNGQPNPPPYGYPPPPQYNPYFPQQQQQYYNNERANFLRRIFAIFIAAFIIAGTIVFILWLVLRPRLPEFRVDSLTVTNFNLSSSQSLVSATWDLKLTARNPNKKMSLSYDRIEASMFYRSVSLAYTTLPPFAQSTKNETGLHATFAAVGTYLDKGAVDGISEERSKSGSVEFNVRMIARVRFKAGHWNARRRFLRVFCGDLTVGVASNSTNGSLTGGPQQCRVGI